MDKARLAEERDLATRNLERDSTELHLVEAALNRIRMGIYGSCYLCDDPITWVRLRVVPDARLCVDCQESLERDGASKISLHEGVTGTLPAQ
jgi:DnaK suppressor protein